MGAKIRTMWMTPFYLYIGTLVIYIYRNNIILNKIKTFNYIFIFLFTLSPALYGYISITKNNKRTDYKGKIISENIQKQWEEKNNKRISYVTGNEWIGGNISYHLKSRPRWVNKIPSNDKMCFDKKYQIVEVSISEFCIGSDD